MLAMFISISLFAQDEKAVNKIFANEIIEETTGYLDREEVKDNQSYFSIIVPPSYYDFDLVRMSVSAVVKKFSDISVAEQWKKTDGGYFTTFLLYEEKDILILITYAPGMNKIIVYTKKKS